jgi:hypothetical protein
VGDHGRIQGHDHRGQVRGRVRVGQRSAEGAAVPDGRVGHRTCRLRQQPAVPGDERVTHHLVVRGERADQQGAALVPDAAQAADRAQVHQQFGVGQPEPQQREQALPARDHLGVLATLCQCAHRVAHR